MSQSIAMLVAAAVVVLVAGAGVADDGLVVEWHFNQGVCISGFNCYKT